MCLCSLLHVSVDSIVLFLFVVDSVLFASVCLFLFASVLFASVCLLPFASVLLAVVA